MKRPGGGQCASCKGAKRGRAARNAKAVYDCDVCDAGMCAEHAVWSGGRYVCLECARAEGMVIRRRPG